ncbi:hypothetical protein B0A50_00733 [Salinomyces thailandicus]|uniref:Uncharacterized protein n=1 Tax=Salinomyces thailandicus TaxID=706561 RepID=A0A4U0UCH3_9PEZI|nr:hypothetical protein B0A50_00733 [Salinomyces thailandica]
MHQNLRNIPRVWFAFDAVERRDFAVLALVRSMRVAVPGLTCRRMLGIKLAVFDRDPVYDVPVFVELEPGMHGALRARAKLDGTLPCCVPKASGDQGVGNFSEDVGISG